MWRLRCKSRVMSSLSRPPRRPTHRLQDSGTWFQILQDSALTWNSLTVATLSRCCFLQNNSLTTHMTIWSCVLSLDLPHTYPNEPTRRQASQQVRWAGMQQQAVWFASRVRNNMQITLQSINVTTQVKFGPKLELLHNNSRMWALLNPDHESLDRELKMIHGEDALELGKGMVTSLN